MLVICARVLLAITGSDVYLPTMTAHLSVKAKAAGSREAEEDYIHEHSTEKVVCFPLVESQLICRQTTKIETVYKDILSYTSVRLCHKVETI